MVGDWKIKDNLAEKPGNKMMIINPNRDANFSLIECQKQCLNDVNCTAFEADCTKPNTKSVCTNIIQNITYQALFQTRIIDEKIYLFKLLDTKYCG